MNSAPAIFCSLLMNQNPAAHYQQIKQAMCLLFAFGLDVEWEMLSFMSKENACSFIHSLIPLTHRLRCF